MSNTEHQLQNMLTECIEYWLGIIEQAYPNLKLNYTDIEIRTDLKGQSAGKASYNPYTTWYGLRFNMEIYRLQPEAFLAQTVPHELAHIVDYRTRGTSDHGPKWKAIMRAIGVKTGRTHNYILPILPNTFTYKCDCSTYQLSKIRHNRSQRRCGGGYSCPKCRSMLRYATGEQRTEPSRTQAAI